MQGHNEGCAANPPHGAENAPEYSTPLSEGKGSGGGSRIQALLLGTMDGRTPYGGHTRIVNLMKSASPYLKMKQDAIIATYCFRPGYRVKFPSRKEWSTTPGPLVRQKFVWFTYCSKIKEAGLCLSNSRRETSIPVSRHCTVFHAEFTAPMACALKNYQRGYKSKNMCIGSDS